MQALASEDVSVVLTGETAGTNGRHRTKVGIWKTEIVLTNKSTHPSEEG